MKRILPFLGGLRYNNVSKNYRQSAKMKTVLLITKSPHHPKMRQALDCAKNLFKNNELAGVFFYGDGAMIANGFAWQSAELPNIADEWAKLSDEYQLALPVCVSTALARGITDEPNAKRHNLSGHNLKAPFELVGLGDLAMMIDDNKLIQF